MLSRTIGFIFSECNEIICWLAEKRKVLLRGGPLPRHWALE